MKHAVIYVLGPWSQSPRMRNHRDELLSRGYSVSFVAYEIDLSEELERATPCPIAPLNFESIPQLLSMAAKILLLTIKSCLALSRVPEVPELVIAQVHYPN